jgi:undecaprenyl-diphosphatase
MLEVLNSVDSSVLVWIHQHLHNGFLDWLMVLIRNKIVWLPLYVFLLSFVLINFGRRSLLWAAILIFAVGLCDTVSSKVIKYQVQRLRPCHTELSAQMEVLIPCGGRYSFTSSHATNHFGVAVFIFFTLGRLFRKIRWPLVIWASAIAFAQVYVGVHYPLDVIAGGLLGSLIGAGLAWYYNHRLKRWSIYQQPLRTEALNA